MGVAGGVAVVLSVVLILAYRNYRYEQELDSLLWKIEPSEIKVATASKKSDKLNVNFRFVQEDEFAPKAPCRTSQVSLASQNDDADFRFAANIYYTRVGFYKGRLFAMRKVSASCPIDITRSIKKELKASKQKKS